MSERLVLTAEQRAAEMPSCDFYEGCVVGCHADPMDAHVVLDTWGCGAGSTVYLSPDEARQEARALLAAADYAEFGPGDWRDGKWHQHRSVRGVEEQERTR